MTRGNSGDLQPFDLEIDRNFHRLVRHSVHPGHSVHFEHLEHFEYSIAGDSEYSDFEHSTTNFHTKNMDQPPPCERTLGRWLHLISLMKACAYKLSPLSCLMPEMSFLMAVVLDARKNFSKNTL